MVGVISAFNYDGGVVVERRARLRLRRFGGVEAVGEDPLTALGVGALFPRRETLPRARQRVPDSLLEILVGGRPIGEILVDDTRVAVLSTTGSTPP